MDAVVTSGIGQRAIERLNAGGAKVYRAEGGTVRDIVERFKSGQAHELSPEQACAGHDDGNGHAMDVTRNRYHPAVHSW